MWKNNSNVTGVILDVVKKLDFIKLEKIKSNFFQTNYVIKLEKTK